MAFLIPAFLSGLLLVGVPWIIHRIRRPERTPLTFSSLMFVPRIKKEVIERRKVQHLLLMLLRMLLVLLLVFAFSRPFQRTVEQTPLAPNAPAQHLILLDTSYSMGFGDAFPRACREADSIIDSVPQDAAIGVITFNQAPRVLVPIAQGNHQIAREAIKSAMLTRNATNYMAAMQFAESRLLARMDTQSMERTNAVLHLVSDFQKQGLPTTGNGWRLSSRIQFRGHAIERDIKHNLSLDDIGVRHINGDQLLIAGKIKNWSNEQNAQVKVGLYIDDKPVQEQDAVINAGNATRISFALPWPADRSIEGRLELEAGDPTIDNRRYFVWRPPRKTRILLVADRRADTARTSAWFLEQVFPLDPGAPWDLQKVDQTDLPQQLNLSKPDVILLCDLNGFRAETGDALDRYVHQGGGVLLTLGSRVKPDELNTNLLARYGIGSQGSERENAAGYDMLGQVNFTNPIFTPFQGARFNDFSTIHFYRRHQLAPITDAGPRRDAQVESLARFTGNAGDAPADAMTLISSGGGKLLLWSFSPELTWTNLPKHSRFVPLVHESVRFLVGAREEPLQYLVGARFQTPADPVNDTWTVQLPNGLEQEILMADGPSDLDLTEPGYLKLKQSGSQDWQQVKAVNLPATESDLETVDPHAFALKFTSNTSDPDQPDGLMPGIHEREESHEYGHAFLLVVLLFLVLESWYAVSLSRRQKTI